MGSFSNTPSLVAGGTIAPYRFVKVSGRNTGVQCTAITETMVGVTDGSTLAFNSADHAVSGGVINLQGGEVVLIEASAAISAGALVGTSANGRAVTAATTAKVYGVALEPAAGAAEIIRVFKNSVYVSA